MSSPAFHRNISWLAVGCLLHVLTTAFGQIPNGCTAPNFTLTDLGGTSHTLYNYTAAGKSVLLFFAKTSCPAAWEYHQTAALQTLWAQRGPSGTLSQDVRVIFVESDPATPNAALTTPPQDWTSSTAFPICNPVTAAVPAAFGIANYPAMVLVCPNNTIRKIPTVSATAIYDEFVADCACRVPDFVVAFPSGATTANIVWDKPNGATKYQLQYKLSSASTWITKAVTPNYFALTGLTNGATYDLRVRPFCNGAFTATYSPVTTFTLSGTSCGQSTPAGNFAPISTTSTRVFWQYGLGATNYQVRFRRIGTSTWVTRSSTPSALTVSGLVSGATYEWQVRSSCSGVLSAWSESNQFSVLCAAPPPVPQPGPTDDRNEENADFAEGPTAPEPVFSLSPNPVSERLFVHFENIEPIALRIFDASGRLILTEKNPSSSTELEISALPAGFYFARLETASGAVLNERFLKEN